MDVDKLKSLAEKKKKRKEKRKKEKQEQRQNETSSKSEIADGSTASINSGSSKISNVSVVNLIYVYSNSLTCLLITNALSSSDGYTHALHNHNNSFGSAFKTVSWPLLLDLYLHLLLDLYRIAPSSYVTIFKTVEPHFMELISILI